MSDSHHMRIYISLGNGKAVGITADGKELAIFDMEKHLILARLGEATTANIDALNDALDRLYIHATDHP